MTITPPVSPGSVEPHRFASYVGSRLPQHKTHKTMGQAKQALVNKFNRYRRGADSDMVIWQWYDDTGEWEVVYTAKEGDLEYPWAEENRDNAVAKAKRAEERRQKELYVEAVRMATLAGANYNFNVDSTIGEVFVDAFVSGYLEGKK